MFFMSYSRRDEVVMRRIAMFLRDKGINVWVDNEKLVPGTPIWEAEIEKAIKAASAIIIIISLEYKKLGIGSERNHTCRSIPHTHFSSVSAWG